MKVFLFVTIGIIAATATAQQAVVHESAAAMEKKYRDDCLDELQKEIDTACYRENEVAVGGKRNKLTASDVPGATKIFTGMKERVQRVCATLCPPDISLPCGQMVGQIENDMTAYFLSPGKKTGYSGIKCSNIQASLDGARADSNRNVASTSSTGKKSGTSTASAPPKGPMGRQCNPFDSRGNRILGACN